MDRKCLAVRVLFLVVATLLTCTIGYSQQDPRGPQPRGLPTGTLVRIDESSVVISVDGAQRTYAKTQRTSFVREEAADRSALTTGTAVFALGERTNDSVNAILVRVIGSKGGLPRMPFGAPSDGPVIGEIVQVEPLSVRTSNGKIVELIVGNMTRIIREISLTPADMPSGAKVRIIAPERPGMTTPEVLKVILAGDSDMPASRRFQRDIRTVSQTPQISLLADLPKQPLNPDFIYGIWLGRGLYSREELDRAFRIIDNLGIRYVKVEFKWDVVQPEKNKWRWDHREALDVDYLIELAEKHKVSIIPYFDLFTPWAEKKFPSPYKGECEGPPSGRGQYQAPLADEYADYVFNVVDRLKRGGVDIKYIELDNEVSNISDGYVSRNCFISINAKQIKIAENSTYKKIKEAYPGILVSSTTFSFPGIARMRQEDSAKDRARKNSLIHAYFGEEPKPLFDFLGIHETLSGSGNPFTTLNNTSMKDNEYNFGSYNESYDIWRKILDRYGYRDTPIINLESSAIMTGKQDAELVQRAVFARTNSSRNRVGGWILSQLTGSKKFTEGGEMSGISVGIAKLGNGTSLREGYLGYYNLLGILAQYPRYEGKLMGELNSGKLWVERFSGDKGTLLVAFIPYHPGPDDTQKSAFSTLPGRDVTITGPDTRKTIKRSDNNGYFTVEVGQHPVFIEIKN